MLNTGAATAAAATGSSTRICLCMIVRDEAQVLERCLDAALPLLDAVSICDTGSTDGTPEVAARWLEAHGIAGRVHHHAWRDFGHNRTLSIAAAQETLRGLGFDLAATYLLFLDADQVLGLQHDIDREQLTADVYSLLQHQAGMIYANDRLARASLARRFVGATHEYFEKPAAATNAELAGLVVHDRNDGGARGDKFERDIRLLEKELASDPGNARAMFYLAQSYRALGEHGRALFWYVRRIAAGGWFEEIWYSHYAIGLMQLAGDDLRAGLRAMHAAIRLDPTRAEPFFHLACHLRNRGRHRLAMGYARRAGSLAEPAQQGARRLFYEGEAYRLGPLRELAISGYYSSRPDEGMAAAETLALGRDVPAPLTEMARANQIFYAQPLSGASYRQIAPALPPLFVPCNPSLVHDGHDGYLLNCRAVSYRVQPGGRYTPAEPDHIYRTRNLLMRLDRELRFVDQSELICDLPPLRWARVQGLEDVRLVVHGDAVRFTCTTYEHHPHGTLRMSLGALDADLRLQRLLPLTGVDDHRVQRNWLPFVDEATGELRAVYSYEPFTTLSIDAENGRCTVIDQRRQERNLQEWRGGAGPVTLPDSNGGGRLLLIHEVAFLGRRYYTHRLVRIAPDGQLAQASLPFYFLRRGIEFATGLCLGRDRADLLVTFGSNDAEAWLCTLPLAAAMGMLRDLP